MDYEKKYNEALAWMRSVYPTLQGAAKEDAEHYFPELRESEDERIRRELIEYLRGDLDDITTDDTDRWINWIEKQKDCILVPKSHLDPVGKLGVDGMKILEKQKEQKHVETSDFKTKLAEYLQNNSPKDGKYVISSESILKMAEEELLKRGVVQKPAESISQLTVQGKGVYKICPRCKERMVRDDSMVYTSMPPQYRYECPKCGEMEFDTVMYDNPEMEEQKPAVTHGETYHVDTLGTQQVIAGKMPQKPAEWSKNDTVFLNEIIDFFENKTVRLQHDIDMYAHWLKSLPERFVLQPKAEWSEEDNKMIKWLISYFEQDNVLHAKTISWLKSLRPSWKPSEDEERLINTSISFLKDFADKGYENAVECIDWLKSKLNGNSGK